MLPIARIGLALSLFAALIGPATGGEPVHLRLGLVKFGSAAWEIETAQRLGFDHGADLIIDKIDLANPAAGEVALLSGAVDIIFTDWIWVARQRGNGQKVSFAPHNAHLGDLLVAADSPIHALADLDGKRIGVAGGPNDKNWLLLRLLARRQFGHDLNLATRPVYAAPPLLSQEMESGRLDAVLTYWPYAARLKVKGYRPLLPMSELLASLGLKPPVPLLGFAANDSWLTAHPAAMANFLEMLGQADRTLADSDEAWTAIRPLTGAENDAVFIALRQRFRQGIVAHWSDAERDQATTLFALLLEVGAADLTNGAEIIPKGTFWIRPAS